MAFRRRRAVRPEIGDAGVERAGGQRADLGALERAEATGKTDLHVVAHGLVAEHDDDVLLERRAHLAIGPVAARHIDQIDAAQLGAKSRTQCNDFHEFLASQTPSRSPIKEIAGQVSPLTKRPFDGYRASTSDPEGRRSGTRAVAEARSTQLRRVFGVGRAASSSPEFDASFLISDSTPNQNEKRFRERARRAFCCSSRACRCALTLPCVATKIAAAASTLILYETAGFGFREATMPHVIATSLSLCRATLRPKHGSAPANADVRRIQKIQGRLREMTRRRPFRGKRIPRMIEGAAQMIYGFGFK